MLHGNERERYRAEFTRHLCGGLRSELNRSRYIFWIFINIGKMRDDRNQENNFHPNTSFPTTS